MTVASDAGQALSFTKLVKQLSDTASVEKRAASKTIEVLDRGHGELRQARSDYHILS